MTAEQKPRTTRRRSTARKPKAPAFQPIEPTVANPKFLSPENQTVFHTIFMGLTPEQRQGAILVLNAVANAPLLNEGYRKFFAFWRQYGPNASQDLNVNF